jgi:hypothetical protein
MKIVWPWERRKVQQELDSIEHLLESAFKPVSARPTFITSLRKRLVGSKNPFARVSLSTLELLLLISGAIASLVAMLFMLVRTIVGVFGRLRPGGGKPSEPRPPRAKKPKLAETKKGTA